MIIVGCLPMPMATADVLFPGEKSVGTSFTLLNMNEYPDYVFILFGTGGGVGPGTTPGQIPDKPFSFYKAARPTIYAIRQEDYNMSTIQKMNYSELDQYFNHNPLVKNSGLTLEPVAVTVDENDPLQSSQIILTITSLTNTSFTIQKTKIIYTYTDGTTEEKVFVLQDQIPERSRIVFLPSWFISLWYVWVVIIVIIIVLFIVLRRTRAKHK